MHIVEKDKDFLERVHVCIIADGYDKLSKEFLKSIEKAGIFNAFETIDYTALEIKPGSNDHEVKYLDLKFINSENMNENRRVYGANNIVHCFSRAMMFNDWFDVFNEEQQSAFKINDYSVHDFLLGSSTPGQVKTHKFKHMPLPIHMVIKHKNQGKIESHKWFFKGFCEYMDPIYAQIIDCGSIPLWKSISTIIWHMETIPEVGGACGEIEVMLPDKKEDGSAISFIESILLRGQYVEYKLSHYMDKAAESLFGFVSVLPGAFSTFRWECIKGQPLNAFLKGSKDEFGDISKIMSCGSANKYLAEDRIMCLEIIAKEGQDYVLHYVPGAKCLTDPPLSLTGLLKQRRRWFNGSLFASFHVLLNMCRIWKRGKCSFCRNLFYMILYVFMILQMILSLVLVGSFYGSYSIFLRAILPSDDCLSITRTANVLENIYLVFLFMVIVLSTTVSVDWAETGFRVCSVAMGIFTLLMVGCSIVYAFQATIASVSVIFLALYAISYILPLIMNVGHLKVCDFLKGVCYSIYLAPTYINLFTIFAISNIHDVSWGSRPSAANEKFNKVEEAKTIKYKNYRSNCLVIWLILNTFVGYLLVYLSRNGQYYFMLAIGGFLMVVMMLKLMFAVCYWLKSKNDRRRAYKTLRQKSSEVFSKSNVKARSDLEAREENVFETYGELRESVIEIKAQFGREENINYRTSVNDDEICMGHLVQIERDRKSKTCERNSTQIKRSQAKRGGFGKLGSITDLMKTGNERMIPEDDSEDKEEDEEEQKHQQKQKDYDSSFNDLNNTKNIMINKFRIPGIYEESKNRTSSQWDDVKASITEGHRKFKNLNEQDLVDSRDINVEIDTPESGSNYDQSEDNSPEKLRKTKQRKSSVYRNSKEFRDFDLDESEINDTNI